MCENPFIETRKTTNAIYVVMLRNNFSSDSALARHTLIFELSKRLGKECAEACDTQDRRTRVEITELGVGFTLQGRK